MDYDLDRINRERRAKGLPPLTRQQADSALSSRRYSGGSNSDDTMSWLVLYAVMSGDSSPARAEPVVDSTPTPTYEPPADTSRHESSHSSPSDYSGGGGYDSGGSSGGSDSSGGGGSSE